MQKLHAALADLAVGRGWRASEVNYALMADAAVIAAWPDGETGLRDARLDDELGIETLHDAEFPGTYATAGSLLARHLEGTMHVLVVEGDDGVMTGYATGQVHPDGEGFIDFVVVREEERGHGLGRRLVVSLARRLVEQASSGRVSLSVQEQRAPARALYERLGFRTDASLVGYRSP